MTKARSPQPYSAKHRCTIKMFLDEFEKLISDLMNENGSLLLCGDFNIDWKEEHNPNCIKLRNILMMHNLTQLVNKTTHVKGGMLDLLIMDKSLLKSDTLVITDTTFRTDHHPIVMKLPSTCRIRNNAVIVRSVRELYKFDMSRFSKALKDEDIANPSFVLGLNISEAISLYNSTLARLLDDQCPIVTKRYRLKHWNSRWYNSSLKELKRKKRAAERKYRKNQCVRNEFGTAYEVLKKYYRV